jgi:hypothetical protein
MTSQPSKKLSLLETVRNLKASAKNDADYNQGTEAGYVFDSFAVALEDMEQQIVDLINLIGPVTDKPTESNSD